LRLRVGALALVVIAALLAWNYLRPIPVAAATAGLPAQTIIAGTPPTLPWPSTGSAAVGVSGLGAIATSGNEQPIPMASVAKVMTALVVLTDMPLHPGESGSSLTMSQQDVDTYNTDSAQGQSAVVVSAGESLTELQLLQGMLIPSANNFAEMLARWDATTVSAFVDRMNQRAKALGLTSTRFADPAGISPQTVSTPTDLMRLGMAAMKDPVFASIVKQPQVSLPVAGVRYNVDAVIGKSGIVGIKTGSGLQTGANFLFAASVAVSSHPVTIFGCVMGQPTLAIAFDRAEKLIAAVQSGLSVKQALARNQAVGHYDTAWDEHSDLVSSADVLLVEWPGMVLREQLIAPKLSVDQPISPGTSEGTLRIILGDYDLSVALLTATQLYPPGRLWRITRLPGD
jgi:D-alanyl-D-alanine carboxypeptidase (penicillin-binding protein 5/6)